MSQNRGLRNDLGLLVAVAAIGLAATCGCGGDGIPRVSVSGTVTLDGRPLEQGRILFQPTGGGPSAGGKIVQGEFTIPKSQGPSPGTYRVEILSYQGTGEKFPDPEVPGKMEERTRNVVPPRYNKKTELRAEIKAEGPNRFEYPLESR